MKYYIIRLKGNEISETHARDCIEQAKKFGIEVNYFDAINGLEYQRHLDELKISPRYKFKKGRPGVFGCFLSHFYLWQSCARKNVPFCILEHDGYFIKPLPQNILDTFSEVLKLDNLDPFSKSYNDDILKEENLPIEVKKYHNPQAKFLEKNGTGNYMRGAYGYIIKPRAAAKMLPWIKTHGFLPADNQLGDAVVDIQVTTPTIVRLHPNYYGKIGELSLTGNTNLL
jgi:GR25 family glycosyltransferase involved in LPS biosynthesis